MKNISKSQGDNDLYRLIKQEEIDGNGNIETLFIIQKKYFFCHFIFQRKYFLGWANCLYRAIDYNYFGVTPGRTYDYVRADLYYYDAIFKSEKWAKHVLNRLKKPFYEKYKGERITRVFGKNWDDVYVNLSRYDWDGHSRGYEHSYSLDKLKKYINERKVEVKTRISVVKLEDKDDESDDEEVKDYIDMPF